MDNSEIDVQKIKKENKDEEIKKMMAKNAKIALEILKKHGETPEKLKNKKKVK